MAHHGGYYSVVNYNSEEDQYTFAHELGHNMYLNHDRWTVVNVPEGGGDLNDPYPYSHGYISTNCRWLTIMAYPNRCEGGVPTVGLRQFSNPNQMHLDGERIGVFGDSPSSDVDGPADAVRSLNERRRAVERNWHPSSDREAAIMFRRTVAEDYNCYLGPISGWATFDADGRVTSLWDDRSVRRGAEIPSWLDYLTELRRLLLSARQYGGELPASIGNLTKLEELYLPGDFTGGIPATFGNLTNLSTLQIDGPEKQRIPSGEIPPASGI